MDIRAATAEDIPQLRAMAQRIWEAVYRGMIPDAQIDYMLARMYAEDVIQREIAGGVAWEIVSENAGPAGFLAYERQPDGRVKLHKLYLSPECHGSGLGQKALAHLIVQAAGLGAHSVWLQVNKRNARAIAAYRKAGFHIEQEAVFDIGEGFVMDDFLMARPI
jgi:ribosomal protein S18 acetylase RimI-like enzyme